MKYVALLRGINVGGKNIVDMKQLKAALESAGLQQVTSYINSGNILFSDTNQKQTILQQRIEKIISQEFGLTIRVLLINEQVFDDIAKAIPSEWANDTTRKCDVLFLWDNFDHESVVNLLPLKPGIDTASYVPGAIIWSIERKNVTRSGIPKIIGTELYAHTTIRNCNTVRKLQQLLRSM